MLMKSGGITFGVAIGALFALVGSGPVVAASKAAGVPYATPPGVTLVEAVAATQLTRGASVVGLRLGDGEGAPLYVYDQDGTSGKPTCLSAECAQQFPPLLADRHAIASGDWSIAIIFAPKCISLLRSGRNEYGRRSVPPWISIMLV